MSATYQKRDAYQEITNKVIESLEAGVSGNWQCPWNRPGLPVNASTGANYRGTNVFWLAMCGMAYSSSIWATYKQWQSIGAQVRKGEKSAFVIYYDTFERENDQGGTDVIPFVKTSPVFNADQVEGYEAPVLEMPDLAERLEHAEAFASGSGASIRTGESRAYYSPSGDYVNMPNRRLFRDTGHGTATEHYYSTLLHELTHWTGHKSRLDRNLSGRFGNHAYAFEELVAELGSAFLCNALGIERELRQDHIEYLATWLKILRKDKRAIVKAASLAQAAVDYLTDKAATQRQAA